MAWYTITFSCGHTGEVNLIGKGEERERRIQYLETSGDCPECYKKRIEANRAAQDAAAKQAAIEQELPALTGTEKQIAWAETLRQKMLASLEEMLEEERQHHFGFKQEALDNPVFMQAVDSIYHESAAKWWIDHRFDFNNYFGMIYLLRERFNIELQGGSEEIQRIKEEKELREKRIAREAKIEATVRPEEPETGTVAEILLRENSIDIDFPERRKDFRSLVRGLGYRWKGGYWHRGISVTTGTIADRAAEVGSQLLVAGFIIRIYDQDIRGMAAKGNYEPEHARWITEQAKGSYAGWFRILWKEYNDRLYREARKLTRSHWYHGAVVVPPEMFEEVADFAQRYDFRFSPAANEVLKAAAAARDCMLVATPTPIATAALPAVNGVPRLEIPKDVEIDEELRDDN